DDFIRKNASMLSTEAKDLFKNMGAEDQRRVVNSGPLNIYRDTMAMFKFRVAISREREQEIADRKGGDFVAKEASEAEVQDWCRVNKDYLGEEGIKQLDMFGPADQWRIISEGPAAENMDSVHIIQSRAKRSREMANTVATMFAQRRELANKTAQETIVAKAAAKPLFNPTMADTVQAFFTRVVGCEVPESQRRCGGFGVQHELEEDRSKLVGKVKGVDGVVEILKPKYECRRGDRYRVIGEHGGPAGMWRLEGGKTVPKTHVKEGGWKWVLEEPEPEAKAAKPIPVQTTPVATFTPKERDVQRFREVPQTLSGPLCLSQDLKVDADFEYDRQGAQRSEC
ncbi:SLC38A6, partial [Symbiodinium sp. KB8]